ncbi:MAG: hypothetical protein QME72_14140 [Rhodococcus sp. (in: high G+C Gram-positive bacteria)]|nr:hypothetical protein [Rhodococcus sp. (in: high G+C Gram-positive bacteria)]MDI6628852.1 hypothetical protein [Rhodococcus sp. (in: high G+C Gram-positive bacteria)]
MTTVRSRQRRALAAGGIVLGFGAVLVAASWTDNVLGFANFQSGQFGIQSSVDNGVTWSSNPVTGTNNPLSFAPSVNAVVPGSVSYAPIRLRTDVGSLAATIELNGAQLTGDAELGGALVYRAVKLATPASPCGSAAFTGLPSWVVGSAGAVSVTTGSAPNVFTLPAGTPTSEGASITVCFEISLPASPANWANPALQGKTATPDWAFVGTS